MTVNLTENNYVRFVDILCDLHKRIEALQAEEAQMKSLLLKYAENNGIDEPIITPSGRIVFAKGSTRYTFCSKEYKRLKLQLKKEETRCRGDKRLHRTTTGDAVVRVYA